MKRWIIKKFLLRYFKSNDFYIIGCNVVNCGDHFISLEDIVYCLENDVLKDDYFRYYDWSVDNASSNLGLEQFLTDPAERKAEEDKYIASLKQRVLDAQETLREEIEKYGRA